MLFEKIIKPSFFISAAILRPGIIGARQGLNKAEHNDNQWGEDE